MINLLIALGASIGVAFAAVLFADDITPIPAAVPVVTGAETVVAVGAALPMQANTGKAYIRAWIAMTVGTGTTAITVRIYRGTTAAGVLLGPIIAQVGTFTAGQVATFTGEATDLLASVGAAQYCVTVQQTGAGGNGNVTAATIETRILSG